MSEEQRVIVRWAGGPRDGMTGVVVGSEETGMGPMVRVRFDDGEEGLYQHEYLGVARDPLEDRG